VVEGESGGDGVEHRGERGASRGATLTLGALALGHLFEQGGRATEPVLGTRQDDAAPAVAHAHDDASRVRQVGQSGTNAFGALAGDAQHRVAQQPAAASDDLDSRAGQAREGEELGIGGSGERLRGDVALRVADDGHRLDLVGVETLALERTEAGELREEDARQGGGRRNEQVGVREAGWVVVLS
jgi:hypothetical protein